MNGCTEFQVTSKHCNDRVFLTHKWQGICVRAQELTPAQAAMHAKADLLVSNMITKSAIPLSTIRLIFKEISKIMISIEIKC